MKRILRLARSESYVDYLHRLKTNPKIWLHDVPYNDRTYEICCVAVEYGKFKNVRSIPPEYRTDNHLCSMMIRHLLATYTYELGTFILCYPKKHVTYELCRALICKHGHSLEMIPRRMRTYDICLFAVQTDGFELLYVPFHLKTRKMCALAVLNFTPALKFVPRKYKELWMCELAVKDFSFTIEFVPTKYRTYKFCLYAVSCRGCSIEGVPRRHRTREMLMTAVKSDGTALETITGKKNFVKREEDIDYELCLAAVTNKGHVLMFVPVHLKTKELCDKARAQGIYQPSDGTENR